MKSLVQIEFEWLDGSFVTTKSDPGDLDVTTFIRGDRLAAISVEDRGRVIDLTLGGRSKLEFGCDSYLVVIWDDGHPWHEHYLQWRGYWDHFWSRHRDNSDKGYVEVREST